MNNYTDICTLLGFGYLSCLRDNGGCSHFCIPSSDGATFSCGCPNGYNFIDSTTCEFVVPETTAPPTVTGEYTYYKICIKLFANLL